MNHQVLMRVFGAVAHSKEPFQAFLYAEALLVAIAADALAVDILHHEIGPAVRRRTAVKYLAKVGMIKMR